MKDKLCEGCILINEPGPVDYEGPENPNVLFLGEALGAVEIQKGRPFVGPAGRLLRTSVTQTGIGIPEDPSDIISRYLNVGISNVWRCRPPHNIVPPDDLGVFCQNALRYDVVTRGASVVVPLGGTALDAVTEGSMGISSIQGKMFTTDKFGESVLLLPMYHPSFLIPRPDRKKKSNWRDWEISFDKLCMFLRDGSINYIPLSERHVNIAQTHDQAVAFIERLRTPDPKFRLLACDIETASFNMPWENGEILSIAFAWSPYEACVIPWRLVTAGSKLYEVLKALLESPDKVFLWYNGHFDVQFLWAEGIETRIDGDAMFSAYLLDERNNVHSLKKDSAIYLNASDWESELKKYKIPNNKEPETQEIWRQIPDSELLPYNGWDVCHTYHLETVLHKQFNDGLTYVYENIMIPATAMLSRAKYYGMRIDMYRVKELRDVFVPVLEELTQKCCDLVNDSMFNPNSSIQKLERVRERGFKVDNVQRATLERYEGTDDFIDALIAYSEAHKMYSTYIMGIVDDISEDDLKIHPDFKLFGTETGRLSAKNPNVLGMPRKAEEHEHAWKRLIKEIFRACDGNLLVHVDRSQSEVRCAAFLSNDEMLIDILNRGTDLHGEMARQMYGDNYTHEQRVWAKMVTFGLIYNREASSLSKQLKCTIRQAQAVIDKFFAQMPRMLQWKTEIMAEALREKQLTSYLGRIRRFGLISPQNKKDVENEAVNFPVSSISSDLNLLGCVEIMKHYSKYGVEILVPIHDAALFEIPKTERNLIDEIVHTFEEVPGRILNTNVPFPVEVSVGERWSDL